MWILYARIPLLPRIAHTSLQSDAGPWLFVSTILSRLTARDHNPATLPPAHEEHSHSMRQIRNSLPSLTGNNNDASLIWSPTLSPSRERSKVSSTIEQVSGSYLLWSVCTRHEVAGMCRSPFLVIFAVGFFCHAQSAAEVKRVHGHKGGLNLTYCRDAAPTAVTAQQREEASIQH